MAAHFEEHGHHVTPTRDLGINLAKLVVLMILTVFAAKYTHFLPTMGGNLVAMGIAIIKAYLVISIFMGVKFSTNLTKLYAIGGFVWFLLIFGILIDYASRSWELVKGWEDVPSSSLPRADDYDE